jgi:hypothetical protein
LAQVLRDKRRQDLVRELSVAFSAEDFSGLEAIMQRAKGMESHSPDYAQVVAENLQHGQASGLSGPQPAHNHAIAGPVQQRQAPGGNLQLRLGSSDDGSFNFAQPLGFPGITPLSQTQHSGNVTFHAEQHSERSQALPFKVGPKASTYIDLTESDDEKVLHDVA